MELKIVRKYKSLLLSIWGLFQWLNGAVPYDIISITSYSVIQWKSSLLENHLSQSTPLEKISILTIFFFNRKLNELQVIPISCMKGLEKSHNDFRDCSHWETFNIFWCLYLYSGSKHCDVKSKGKKCNLVWYDSFLPRVKKNCWMGYFLVWKAFINTDFFFTIQTWGPLILARYMLGTCMPKNKINVKKKKILF